MPEGDSIHTHARRIDSRMTGKPLLRVGGTEPSVRRRAAGLRGATITAVEAMGKHLLIDFSGGWSLRVHLGMSGRWRFGPPSGSRGDGPARVVLETAEWSARCYGAPTVELDRTPLVRDRVASLGPDLVDSEPDIDEAVRRVLASEPARSISDVVLDQHIVAGIGNVYRNEVLFEAGVHPEMPVGEIDEDSVRWILMRASAQLQRNVGRGRRSTTGGIRSGSETFVYGRGGRPCRRCGTAIATGRSTDHERITYWCPTCQPAPGG